MANKKTRILAFDLETAPSMGAYFELYREGNIVWNTASWFVMSWSAKWLDEDKVMAKGLPDYPLYNKEPENDRELMKDLWKLIDEADIIYAHNGDEFDVKKMNARFIKHGLPPPSPYKTIDTKKVAKRYFKFDSNKLTDLGKYLGLGEKLETGGFGLWKKCLQGDRDAWKLMIKYNKQDVLLLEEIYLTLRPWMTNHPNTNLTNNTLTACPNCQAAKLQKRGYTYTRVSIRQRYQCTSCFAWCSGEIIKLEGVVAR